MDKIDRPTVPAIDEILGHPFKVLNDGFVRVVNPARLRYFALMQRQDNKTDQADAQLIAQPSNKVGRVFCFLWIHSSGGLV